MLKYVMHSVQYEIVLVMLYHEKYKNTYLEIGK